MNINRGSEISKENKKLDEQVISNHQQFMIALHRDCDTIELLKILNKRLERLLKRRLEKGETV